MGTFLVVEDDKAVARVIVRALRGFGEVSVFASHKESKVALEQKSYDGIIVDVTLPDGSGFDTLREARARYPTSSIPALVISGRVDAERLADAEELGATYLLKPVATNVLARFARRALLVADIVGIVLTEWQTNYALTPSETDVLRLASVGHERSSIPGLRSVEPSTVKKQVMSLLRKTLDSSLESAVNRLLREALERRAAE